MAGAERPLASAGKRRWTLLYDADCGLCAWLLSLVLRWDRAGRLRPLALQRTEADELLGELAPAERIASWHLVAPSGERRSAGAALPALLRLLPGGRLPAACLERAPEFTERGYGWVAAHRSFLSRPVAPSSKRRARRHVRRRERACNADRRRRLRR
jgi:predicted DCC family thiol-disulfide oxidoreductase YuxK